MAVTPVGQNRPQVPAQFEATQTAAQKSGSGAAVAYAEANASTGQNNAVQNQFAQDTFDPNGGVQANQANALGGADTFQDSDPFSQALNSLVQALNSVVELVKGLVAPDQGQGAGANAGAGQDPNATGGADANGTAGGTDNGTGTNPEQATVAPGEQNPTADPNAPITRDMLDARGGGPAPGDPLAVAGGGPARFGMVQSPALQGTEHGAFGVAGINQNDPNADGPNADYKFGQTNCAPTAMAEIARGKSLADPSYSLTYKDANGTEQTQRVADMSNEQLVSVLGQLGETNDQGTSPNGVIDMATALGEPVTNGEVQYDHNFQKGQPSNSFDQNWLDQKLGGGEKVVVNGAYEAKDDKGNTGLVGHYMTIAGKNQDGTYAVMDPWDGKQKNLSADEVRRFMQANPYNGGVMLAIGKSAEEQAAQG